MSHEHQRHQCASCSWRNTNCKFPVSQQEASSGERRRSGRADHRQPSRDRTGDLLLPLIPSPNGSLDDDSLLPLLIPDHDDDPPATPVLAMLLGRRADDDAAARGSATPAVPTSAPVSAAAMPGTAPAAASTGGQQPVAQQDSSSAAGDADAASAPYLQVPRPSLAVPPATHAKGLPGASALLAQLRVHAYWGIWGRSH